MRVRFAEYIIYNTERQEALTECIEHDMQEKSQVPNISYITWAALNSFLFKFQLRL
jgi:hypothetical protein